MRDSRQPIIRFHDVRHSHASLLLEAGVSPQIVSARLGHASIKTTLDIYAEVLPAMDEDAAARFEDHVWGPGVGAAEAHHSDRGTHPSQPRTPAGRAEVPAPPGAGCAPVPGWCPASGVGADGDRATGRDGKRPTR